ncbi:MAG: NAD(P)H-hydrate dehydratase [Clostridia bacterium]|nr:NAD(P)H-hydrate dehydratase [Clostridia bacterium]
MERIVTGAQAKALDRERIEGGIPSIELMRIAAQGIAHAAEELRSDGEPVTAICGTGNNGGDGVCAAWLLKKAGVDARVVLCGDEQSCTPDTRYYLTRAYEAGVPVETEWRPAKREVVIDSLFGVGLNRPVEGRARTLIERMNESGFPIVSADLPSGLHADSGRILGEAVKAARTVTMQAKKAGMLLGQGRALCGGVTVQPLYSDDSEPKLFHMDESDAAALLPKRPFDSHKGSNGRTLLCVGSNAYPGAALLSAKAALRGGAGLLTVCTPDPVRPYFAALPEAITLPTGTDDWGETAARTAIDALSGKQAIGIGCGCGAGDITPVVEAALRTGTKLVLDADALNQTANRRELFSLLHENVVLTPHAGEMARLLHTTVEDVLNDPLKAVSAFPCTTLLKGATTLVHANGRTAFLTFGNPGLAKGGSGDVLTGLITALLAQGLSAFDAARCGAYLLGTSADKAMRLLGERALLAGDVIDMVQS